jgi:hypothetical protein
VVLDVAAAAHRTRLRYALAYVDVYRKRGALLPPSACERCGIEPGARPRRIGAPERLVPWHPDPAHVREIAWLCGHCRRYVRATREPLTLAWTWPGLPATRPRGRPPASATPANDPAWIGAGETAAAAARTPGLSDDLFLYTFLEAAGEAAVALRLQGLRADTSWAPSGHARLDGLLRAWIKRDADEVSGEGRIVTPVPAWERRPRRDRLPLLPQAPPSFEGGRELAVVDEKAQAVRMTVALERLSEAEMKADSTLERVQRALNQLHARFN